MYAEACRACAERLTEPDYMQRRTGGGTSPQSPTDAAVYIATLAQELAEMARSHGLESLSYILEMARLEADQVAKGSDGGNDAA
jgi:hypothetical protein